MPHTPRNLPRWVSELAPLTNRKVTNVDSFELHSIGTVDGDFEMLGWWPTLDEVTALSSRVAGLAHGNTVRLTLLGTPDEATANELVSLGWAIQSHQVLLAAPTNDVEQTARIPETATLFEAPLDDYDVVEIADFDAPAARGRIRFADGFALLSEPEILASEHTEQFRTAIIANLAAAASSQGLSWLFMVATADNPEGTRTSRGAGWSNATQITRLSRA
jgi:hypothetical protein